MRHGRGSKANVQRLIDTALNAWVRCLHKDLVALLEVHGFVEGTSHASGDYVIEQAFVEK